MRTTKSATNVDNDKEELSKEFLADYSKFAAEFDLLARDLFQGKVLDQLAQRFINKYQDYIQSFPFAIQTSYPNGNADDEDLRIVSSEMAVVAAPANCVLAELYRRACQACYLRITFNKSRHKQEDERREAVELGRRAIRHAPNSFLANYWYMIAIGWHVEGISQTRERVITATIFCQATKRCIRLDPHDPLAYHLLGRYYYRVASLTWLERTVAHRVIGYKMEGTFEQAEREFRRALDMKRDWLPTGLWLAKVLLAQSRPIDEVRQWIDYGLKLGSHEPTTEIERDELLELRSKLKLCAN